MASDDEKGGAAPQERVDVKARYAHAKELSAAGSLDEAAAEYVWLWQNIFPQEPSLVGVRVSFMAMEMQAVARRHPSARERFLALRDELTPLVDAGAATPTQLGDWVVLCDVVDENARVLEWFDRMGPSASPIHAKSIELRLSRLLRAEGRWADMGRLYPDPLRQLRDQTQMVDRLPGLTAQRPEHAAQMRANIEQHVVAELSALHAALRAAGRDSEAQAVLEEARKLMSGEQLEIAIADALKAAGVDATPGVHGGGPR